MTWWKEWSVHWSVWVQLKVIIVSSYFVTIFTAASDPIPWSDELRSKEYIIPWSKLKYLCENIGPWILGIDSPGNQYGQRYSKLADDCPYFSMDQAWQVSSPAPAFFRTRALWASSALGVTAPGSPRWLPTVSPTPIKTVRATLLSIKDFKLITMYYQMAWSPRQRCGQVPPPFTPPPPPSRWLA